MLKQLNVKVNINTVPVDDFFDKYVTPGRFDFTVFSWIGTPYPISSARSIYANPKGDEIQQDYARLGSPELDSLLERATAELAARKSRHLGNQGGAMSWREGQSLTSYKRPELLAVKKTSGNFGAFASARVSYEAIRPNK